MTTRWTRLFPVISLILLSAGIYLQTLRYDFVWDDHQFVRPLNAIGGGLPYLIDQARSAIGGWNQLVYRPLFFASFALDGWIWGLNPSGFHLTNLLLHGCVTLLVFRFLSVWTDSPRIGWLSAAVFAVHPVHTEAVAWISGRADLLAGLFTLISLLAAFRSSSGRPSDLKTWGWAAIAGGSFVMALLSKESAVILPALVLLSGLSKRTGSWKTVFPSLAVTTLVAVAYLGLRASVLVTIDSGGPVAHDLARMIQGSRSWMETALVALSVTGEYLRLLMLPLSLKVIYPLPSLPLTAPLVIRSLVLLFLWMIGLAVALRRSAIVAAAMAWILIGLLPAFALFIYTSVSPLAERLLYLPSVGFALLIGMLISKGLRVFESTRYRIVWIGVPVSLLVLFSAGTLYYNKAWADDQRLWENTTRMNPGSSLAHFNLAVAYGDRQRWEGALSEYGRAISIRPDYPEAHYNLGNINSAQGRRDAAIEEYRIAVRLKPDYTDAYINLAVTLHEAGKDDLALRALETGVGIDPHSAVLQNNLANAYASQGRWKLAIEHYETALRMYPDYPEARLNLQRALRMEGLAPMRP